MSPHVDQHLAADIAQLNDIDSPQYGAAITHDRNPAACKLDRRDRPINFRSSRRSVSVPNLAVLRQFGEIIRRTFFFRIYIAAVYC